MDVEGVRCLYYYSAYSGELAAQFIGKPQRAEPKNEQLRSRRDQNRNRNVNNCKSLYVGVLSNLAEPQTWYDVGLALQLAMDRNPVNVALKVKGDGSRYSFFNFTTANHAEFAFDRLLDLKERLLDNDNVDLFEPRTAIRYSDRRPFYQGNPDLRNVHLRNLKPSTRQEFLKSVGERELSDCGFTIVSVSYYWNADANPLDSASCHAIFTFETVEQANQGMQKLRVMMNSQLLDIFTDNSRIEQERQNRRQ